MVGTNQTTDVEVKQTFIRNIRGKVFDERLSMQLVLRKKYKDILFEYCQAKEVPLNQVLTRLVREALENEQVNFAIKNIQPIFNNVQDGENTPFRIDELTAIKFKKMAKENKGKYSSYMNAAIYYFLKHGNFENLPEIKKIVNTEI